MQKGNDNEEFNISNSINKDVIDKFGFSVNDKSMKDIISKDESIKNAINQIKG